MIAGLFSLLSILFTVAMTVVMVVTLRKERRIGAFAQLVSAGVGLLMVPIYSALSGARLRPMFALPLLALGLLVGFLRGFATKLTWRGKVVMGRHSVWFLAGWSVSLVLAQLLTLMGSAVLASLGLLPMVLSTGTQVGMAGNLFLRRLFLRKPVRPAGSRL